MISLNYIIVHSDGHKLELSKEEISKFNLLVFCDKNLIKCFLINLIFIVAKVFNVPEVNLFMKLNEEEAHDFERDSNFPNHKIIQVSVESKCFNKNIKDFFSH